ncbi:DUF1173 family protein [Paenibacillus sp. D51F]
MKFRVDGKVYDFDLLDESVQDRLMKEWHKTAAVECLCQGERHIPNPLLYVKQVNDGLFFANYPSNVKQNIRHDFKCRYNRQGYRSLLEGQGIHVDDDEIKVNLNVDPPKTSPATGNKPERPASAKFTDPQQRKKIVKSERKVHLTALFFTMLQEYKVTEYRPGGKRNIASRLYKIAQIIRVNDMPLRDILYVADNKGKWPSRDKHQLIIGWGRRSSPAIPHPTNPKFVRLPLYSIDDPYRLVTELTMLKSIYEQCTSTVPDVDGGYYLLFRGPAREGDKNIWDRQLCFIPAEEKKTRIPVDSSEEARVIQHLAERKRHFERPLIGNVTELFLDRETDIVLHDTEPKTIVTITSKWRGSAGARQEKREGYTTKGYDYVEWDGISPLPF